MAYKLLFDYVYGIYKAIDPAKMGSITETAPASDTASSGLNGRAQRIAQRITDLITEVITLKNDTALVKADIASLKTIETDSRDHLSLIKDTLSGTVANTYNNIIVAKTAAEITADIQLTKTAYALTAIGLAGAETVVLQVKDPMTGAYFNYLTLTAAAPVASVVNLPITVRLNKSITAASVGVLISHH